MFKNPVLKRELTTENRSLRFPVVLLLFCGLLMLLGLFCLYSFASTAEQTGYVDYSVMLQLYVLVVTAEFALIMIYIPLPAGMSISMERETEQFDLLILTALTPGQIVIGKLGAILATCLLLCVMGTPVLSLVFIYGGIRTTNILLFLGVLVVEVIYTASLGILISSFLKNAAIAVFLNYCVLLFTSIISFFFLFSPYFGFSALEGSIPLYLYYPLLLTPVSAFYELISSQTGTAYAVFHAINSHGTYSHTIITENWLLFSMGIHLCISILALYIASLQLAPNQNQE